MAGKPKYYFDGKLIDEDEALDENGIIRDGVSVHTPVTLRDFYRTPAR